MQKLDNEFFEAYKRLDCLCSDIYGCSNGISRYIDDLEHISYRDRLAVPMVETSYKRLKHLRWVRNQIAHDPGQFQICEESDISQINDFHNDIITGNDPLTKLRKYHEASASSERQTSPAASKAAPPVSNFRSHTPSTRPLVSLGAVLLIFIGAIVALAYLLLRSL